MKWSPNKTIHLQLCGCAYTKHNHDFWNDRKDSRHWDLCYWNLNPRLKIMKHHKVEPKFVVCINNDDYEVSLELRKIYKVLPDARAAEHHYIKSHRWIRRGLPIYRRLFYSDWVAQSCRKSAAAGILIVSTISPTKHTKRTERNFCLFSYLSWANWNS